MYGLRLLIMKTMKTKLIALVRAQPLWSSGVVIVLVGALLFVFTGGGAKSYNTKTVHIADFVEQVLVSGTVVANEDVDLGFNQSGRVTGVYAAVGDKVAAGTVLAEVDNGDLRAAVAQRRAALATQQAKLAALTSGTRPEQLAIDQTAVDNARTALANEVRTSYVQSDDAIHNKINPFFDTSSTLRAQLTISNQYSNLQLSIAQIMNVWKSEIDTSTIDSDPAIAATHASAHLMALTALIDQVNSAFNEAANNSSAPTATLTGYQAQITSVRLSLTNAKTSIDQAATALSGATGALTLAQAGTTQNDLNAQIAAVQGAEADVASAEAALAKTIVVAPFSGTVTKMDAKIGTIVSPTDSQISLQSSGIFEIDTYVPEVSVSGIAPGNTATTTLDAYGTDVSFATKVVSVDPAETLKNGVPTYKTTLTFLSADTRIRSGMTANVAITTGTLAHTIVIPAGAVGMHNGQPYVSVLSPDKKHVVAKNVSTGATPALGQIQITNGLAEGDIFLLAPAP